MTSDRFFHSFIGTEIEIELNEVRYTDADKRERESMQKISDMLTCDLQKTFPYIHQDQTPKYTKVVKCFEKEVPLYRYLARIF